MVANNRDFETWAVFKYMPIFVYIINDLSTSQLFIVFAARRWPSAVSLAKTNRAPTSRARRKDFCPSLPLSMKVSTVAVTAYVPNNSASTANRTDFPLAPSP